MRQLPLRHKALAEFWIESVKTNDDDPVNHSAGIGFRSSDPPQESTDWPGEEEKRGDQKADKEDKE